MILAGEGHSPESASHTFTVPSCDAEAKRFPSGLKQTLTARFVCPLRVRASWPDAVHTSLSCHPTPSQAFAVGATDAMLFSGSQGEGFLTAGGVHTFTVRARSYDASRAAVGLK